MQATLEREALIVGNLDGLIWNLPHLLFRAGFAVDVVATSTVLRASKFVRTMHHAHNISELARTAFDLICTRGEPYDWVIAGDDLTLRLLANLSWPADRRPAYLSMDRAGEIDHIFSKIGLSQALAAGGVQTPPYHIANDWREAAAWARRNGFPVMLKIDASNGGLGVYECNCVEDIEQLGCLFELGQVLAQKKIAGPEIDVTAIYFDHQLVHFDYAQVVKVEGKFGPSVVRTYYPLPLVSVDVLAELSRLGTALRANGFSNISCIEAADGTGRYYFEADLRPNAWADYSRHFERDQAGRIRRWFDAGTCLTPESVAPQGACTPVIIPCCLRMPLWDLIRNRYGVWKYIPFADPRVTLQLLLRASIVRSIKAITPQALQRRIKDWRSRRNSRSQLSKR
ncbi:MAG: hypothetical protein ACLGPM_03880 [Acidobacteriota bacterium]